METLEIGKQTECKVILRKTTVLLLSTPHFFEKKKGICGTSDKSNDGALLANDIPTVVGSVVIIEGLRNVARRL